MNIEEERKAFLEAMKPKLIAAFGCGCLEEGYDKDTFNNENAQEFFECWLAAKAHADSDIKMLLRVCAFESIEHARKWDVDKECRHVTAVTAQQFFDDGLAKGMADAGEMAKLSVHVKKRPHKLHGWGVYVGNTYHMRLAIGATKEDATQWAKDNGYRVIE